MLEPMDLEEELTLKEFASLLGIGLARINDPAPTIPIEHSAKLAMLGYVVDLAGGLALPRGAESILKPEFQNRALSQLIAIPDRRQSPPMGCTDQPAIIGIRVCSACHPASVWCRSTLLLNN
jgi:hypothetical protein